MANSPKNGRREWLQGTMAVLGVGATSATVATLARDEPAAKGSRSAAAPTPGATRAEGPAEAAAEASTEALLAPFAAGHALARWTVRQLNRVEGGSTSVVLTDDAGVDFQVDIYARDRGASALRPPGQSERFDVFLANGGKGSLASHEDHGLAAMAVADVLRHNEARVDCSDFVTLRARLTSSPSSVRRSV